MRLTQIKPVQQPVQCRSADLYYFPLRLRPAEFIFFQPFLPDAEAVMVPVQNLDDISVSVAEGEQIAGEQIQVQLFFYDNGQAVD